jgi:hypothetical protein
MRPLVEAARMKNLHGRTLLPNTTLDRTAGSHALAAAGQRAR